MTKQMLAGTAAAVLAGLLAESALAQTPMPVAMPVTGTPQYVTMARPGLFGRLRARRQMMVVNQSVPMTTTAGTVMVQPNVPVIGVQPAQSIAPLPAGVRQAQYLPTQGEVVQAQATQTAATTTPVAQMSTMQTVQPRMGLLARLRARRGR